jgi:hypothetical protein
VLLSRGGDPVGVGIEEEEEDHAEGHEVHVDQEKDAAVIEAPATLHATDSVGGAGHGDQCGEDEEWVGVDGGKTGDLNREGKAEKDEQNAAEEGSLARVEEAREHTILIDFRSILCPVDYLGFSDSTGSEAIWDFK